MRLTILVLVGCVFLCGVVARAQSIFYDPLFEIPYDPQKIYFDSVPLTIKAHCPGLRDRYASAWLYAKWKQEDTEYFIISGFLADYRNGHVVAAEQDFGIAVAIRGSRCLYDQSEYFLRQEINPARDATPVKAADSVLNGIAADILTRYAKAFGGKKAFLKHITQSARDDLPPVVLKQLEIFEK